MAKYKIDLAKYNEIALQHKNAEGFYYSDSRYLWVKDGIHGTQTYSHKSHEIPTIEIQVDSYGEKSYWIFVK